MHWLLLTISIGLSLPFLLSPIFVGSVRPNVRGGVLETQQQTRHLTVAVVVYLEGSYFSPQGAQLGALVPSPPPRLPSSLLACLPCRPFPFSLVWGWVGCVVCVCAPGVTLGYTTTKGRRVPHGCCHGGSSHQLCCLSYLKNASFPLVVEIGSGASV